jgi:hypothetical protein
MRSPSLLTVERWAFTASGLAVYWAVVGWQIVGAWNDQCTKALAGTMPWVLTLPWSLIASLVYVPSAENENLWLTISTISGALLNGLLFALFIRWMTRERRRRSELASDYCEGPGGSVPDGRPGP